MTPSRTTSVLRAAGTGALRCAPDFNEAAVVAVMFLDAVGQGREKRHIASTTSGVTEAGLLSTIPPGT